MAKETVEQHTWPTPQSLMKQLAEVVSKDESREVIRCIFVHPVDSAKPEGAWRIVATDTHRLLIWEGTAEALAEWQGIAPVWTPEYTAWNALDYKEREGKGFVGVRTETPPITGGIFKILKVGPKVTLLAKVDIQDDKYPTYTRVTPDAEKMVSFGFAIDNISSDAAAGKGRIVIPEGAPYSFTFNVKYLPTMEGRWEFLHTVSKETDGALRPMLAHMKPALLADDTLTYVLMPMRAL